LKRARKHYEVLQKWGKLGGWFYFIGGLVYIGLGMVLLWLFQRMVEGMLNNPNNNQQQNAVAQGFALGMVFGCFFLFIALKGIHYLIQGIKYLRNDPSDHLIVLYHDLLMKLTEESKEKAEADGKDQTS
jgi:amino acid transporter